MGTPVTDVDVQAMCQTNAQPWLGPVLTASCVGREDMMLWGVHIMSLPGKENRVTIVGRRHIKQALAHMLLRGNLSPQPWE